jgi:chaperonin GroEL (HSP60 family)
VKLKEYDRILSAIKDEKLKKKYLNLCEKELRAQFEDQLKDLTITQGRILMKLIHRETQKTTYEIVKELRGSFQASMWQAIARLFGHNMKAEYNPQEEDLMIEKAVALVERGYF